MAEVMMWLALAAYVMTGVHLIACRVGVEAMERRAREVERWLAAAADERCRMREDWRRFALLWRCGAPEQALAALRQSVDHYGETELTCQRRAEAAWLDRGAQPPPSRAGVALRALGQWLSMGRFCAGTTPDNGGTA